MMERLANDEISPKSAVAPVLRFVEFQLDLDRGELRRDGQVVPLRSKSFALLATLAARPGHLHSHAELMGAVWQGRVVGEDSIVQCVHDLREALGDDSKTLLRSVPRRGYRLEAQPLAPAVIAARPAPASAAGAEVDPVAIPVEIPRPADAPTTRRTVLAASIGVVASASACAIAWRALDHAPTVAQERQPTLAQERQPTLAQERQPTLAQERQPTLAQERQPTLAQERQPTLAQERSVAVLPFADLGVDASQAWFAEAIAGELVEDISRLPDTLVIAQASTRPYAAKTPPDLRQVARDLDVRFVLTGSVARADPQVRVQTRLSEAASGRVLWSESFVYPSEREWNWRRDIGPRVAHALDLRMTEVVGEWPPFIAGPASAVREAMRGWALFARATLPAQHLEAEKSFRSALETDPHSVAAWSGLANTLGLRVLERWVPVLAERTALLAEAEAAAHRALALDAGRASAAMGLGLILELTGRREAAVSMFERCITLDASLPRAQVLAAISKMELGRFDEVPAHIDRAQRLSPREPSLQAMGMVVAGQTRFTLGDEDGARSLMLQAIALSSHQINGWLWLAAIDALQGRTEAAQASLQQALRLGSVKTMSEYTSSNVGRGALNTFDARYVQGRVRFKQGLRLAGMRD